MKLNVVRITETERLYAGVYRLDLMVKSALEYCDAAKHEVAITRAFNGTGIVDIEDVHWTSGHKKRPSEGLAPGRPRKRSPPSR